MRFPNKVNTYKNSIVSKFPIVLKELEKGNASVVQLYKKLEKAFDSPAEYANVLNCLYYLNKIEFVPGGDILRNVK